MKARAWALTAGLLLFSLFAEQCPAAESMRHRDWSSLVADDGGVPRARIVSQAQSDGDAFMMLDFDADGRYLARIMVKKPQEACGQAYIPDARDFAMQVRVDKYPVFHSQGKISDTADDLWFTLGSGLDEVFLRQSMRGRWLRVKMQEVDGRGLIVRFSLRGFRAALDRAMALRKKLRHGSAGKWQAAPGRTDDAAYF